MSKIQTFLQNILSARYGKDVRQSIHDAIEEIDKVADTAKGSATESAESARKSAQTSALNAQETEKFRNETEQFRNEALTGTPDGYSNLVQNVASNTVKIDSIIEKADLGIQETVTGEQIHTTDSANAKVREFALFGKATQKTTTGKNLIPYPYQGTSYSADYGGVTVLDDGGIKFLGTKTAAWWFAILNNQSNVNPYYLPKGTYTLSVESTTTINPITIGIIDVSDGSSILSMSIGGSMYKENTFTIDKDTNIAIRTYTSAEKTLDTIIYPMLRLASIEDDTYEPYTGGIPSPNPEYPQEIEVSGASGSVEVKSVGKNLCGKFTNETIDLNTGLVNSSNSNFICSDYFSVESNEVYSISFNGKLTTCRMFFYDENKKYLGSKLAQTQTTPNNCKYARIQNGDNNGDLTIKIQIEKGIVVTEYQPYKETISTIPTPNGLAGIKVSSGGNYTDQNGQQWICDEIVKYADGSGEYIKRLKKYSLVVSDMNALENYPGWVLDDLQSVVGSVNTHMQTTLNIGTMIGLNTVAYSNLFLPRSYYNNLTQTEWKTQYPDLAVDVLVPYTEPITTPLTAEEIAEIEKLSTFYPVTNIFNDADCGMKVTYLADSKIYIDNQLAIQAQAQEEAMAAMLLLLPEETQAAMIENDTNNLLAESEE